MAATRHDRVDARAGLGGAGEHLECGHYPEQATKPGAHRDLVEAQGLSGFVEQHGNTEVGHRLSEGTVA